MSTTTNWPTPEQRAAMRLRLAELEREHHKIKADIKAQLAREAAQEPIRLPDPPIVRARMCAGQETLHITAARGDIVTFDLGPAPTRLDKAKHAVNVGSELALQIFAIVMLIVGGLLVFAEPFLRAIGR